MPCIFRSSSVICLNKPHIYENICFHIIVITCTMDSLWTSYGPPGEQRHVYERKIVCRIGVILCEYHVSFHAKKAMLCSGNRSVFLVLT